MVIDIQHREIPELEALLQLNEAEQALSDFVGSKDPATSLISIPQERVLLVFHDEKCGELLNFGRSQNILKGIITGERPVRFSDQRPSEVHYLEVAMILNRVGVPIPGVRLGIVHDLPEDLLFSPGDALTVLEKITNILQDDYAARHLHALTNYYTIVLKYLERVSKRGDSYSIKIFEDKLKVLCDNSVKQVASAAKRIMDKYSSIKDGAVVYTFNHIITELRQMVYPYYVGDIFQQTCALLQSKDTKSFRDALWGVYGKEADGTNNACTSGVDNEDISVRKKSRFFYKARSIGRMSEQVKVYLSLNKLKDELLDKLSDLFVYVSAKEFFSYLNVLNKSRKNAKEKDLLLIESELSNMTGLYESFYRAQSQRVRAKYSAK